MHRKVLMNVNISKKSQAGSTSAAVLIVIVTLAIILYVMMIPPEARVEILEGTSSGTTPETDSESDIQRRFSFAGPGWIDEEAVGREHLLPQLQLRTRINSKIFAEEGSFHIYRSARSDVRKETTFYIDELAQASNIHLSFVAAKRSGILTIRINGIPIYEGEMTTLNIPAIPIPQSILSEANTIEFSVSSPGWKFWQRNEYIIDNMRIFGDVTDTSEQSSFVTLELTQSESDLLQRALLDFMPGCRQETVGQLRISVNNNQIYMQTPDCQMLNRFDIPPSLLRQGLNTIEFQTERDNYLVEQIKVQTTLRERDDLVYFFELDRDLFETQRSRTAVCGEVDGICPEGCSALEDKDCCFETYPDGYWCTIPTFNANDRCVGNVDQFNVGRCESGYEDRQGRPHPDFEGRCGDNTDGVCPVGCGPVQDKDCCLEYGQYWCPNLPLSGVSSICVNELSTDRAALCPGGYISESGSRFGGTTTGVVDEESNLRSRYKVEVTLEFLTGDRKVGRISINGLERGFNTFDNTITFDVSDFVREDNNYLQLIPQNRFNVVGITVHVRER